MNLQNLLTPQRVACHVAARSRKHTLDILSEMFARTAAGELDARSAFDAMISRERLGCTAVGNGVAMPHGRVAGIRGPLAAFVRLAEPVDFDTPDGTPVDLVFALLVPESRRACQSEELASLAGLFSDAHFRELLRNADSAATLYQLFPGPPALKASASG
jgi:nitrogen PTS system EIIA component